MNCSVCSATMRPVHGGWRCPACGSGVLQGPHVLIPDQPAPAPSTGDVWAEIIGAAENTDFADLIPAMAERRQVGIDRSGTPVQRGNGRDPDQDARQEALDLAVYLWQGGRRFLAFEALRILADIR